MKNNREDERPWKIKNRPYIYAAVLALILTMFVAPEKMEGDSMIPAIQPGDVMVIQKDTYSQKRGIPELEKVVILEKYSATEATEDNLIARIAALPGEKVTIRDNKFYRDGTLVQYDWMEGDLGEDQEIQLSEEEVFLLCDHLDAQLDSRSEHVGVVEMKDIKGNVVLILWPFQNFGGIQ